MPPDLKTAQVNLRLQPSLKLAAEQAAARDHRSLNSLIEKLLSDHIRTLPTIEDWHESVHVRFERFLEGLKLGAIVNQNYRILSYSIRTTRLESFEPAQLSRRLADVHRDVAGYVSSPHLLYPYTRPELAPYFTSNTGLRRGEFDEILECALSGENSNFADSLGLWRASPSGLVTDVRPYREDKDWSNTDVKHLPQRWFSPRWIVRDVVEFIHHAALFGQRFESAEAISFRCEWSGLQERELSDIENPRRFAPGQIARIDRRVTAGEWSPSELRTALFSTASALVGPVLRLFNPSMECSAQWVNSVWQGQ